MTHFLPTLHSLVCDPNNTKNSTCYKRRLRFGHNADSQRVIHSDYLFPKAGLLKMSTNDGGNRVDQYFVTSYTEVCIIIQYRLNLNHLWSISDYNRDLHNENDDIRALKKMLRVRVILVIYCDSLGEPPRRGVCPFLYLQRVPRDMRVVSPPVSLLQFHARTPAH